MMEIIDLDGAIPMPPYRFDQRRHRRPSMDDSGRFGSKSLDFRDFRSQRANRRKPWGNGGILGLDTVAGANFGLPAQYFRLLRYSSVTELAPLPHHALNPKILGSALPPILSQIRSIDLPNPVWGAFLRAPTKQLGRSGSGWAHPESHEQYTRNQPERLPAPRRRHR